jgi:Fe2+ transport system protein FeoA
LHTAPESVRLTDLQPSQEGVILQLSDDAAVQLMGYGVYPGVTVRIRQTFPTFVIQTEETELAIEERLAREIRVRRC